MIVRAYTGHCTHHLKGGRVRQFRPKGEMLVVMPDGQMQGADARAKHRANEDVTRYSEGGLSARLFVGLSAPAPSGKGQVPRYSIKQVVDAVVAIRKEQGQRPDATFLAQKGIYTEGEGAELVEEDSVQIIIIDIFGTPENTFVQQMTDLGEAPRARFEQKEVILEVQNKGVVQAVYGIHA